MEKVRKLIVFILIGLGVLSSIYTFLLFGGDQSADSLTGMFVDHLYVIVIAVFVFSVLIVFLVSLSKAFSDVDSLKKSCLFIVLFASVMGVATLLASDEPVRFLGVPPSSKFDSKISGIGIIMFYILFSGAVVVLLASSFSKLVKR